jgi:ATP-dependent RNA helicase DBP3
VSSPAEQHGSGAQDPGGRAVAADAAVISLRSVRSLVLDEADRMLDLGFSEDLHALSSLIGEVHPATWMFSATWPPSVRALAERLLLPGAIHLTVGQKQHQGHRRGGAQDSEAEIEAAHLVTAASVQQSFERMKGKGAPRVRRLVQLLHAMLGPEATVHEQGLDHGSCDDTAAEQGLSTPGGDVDGKRKRVLVFVLYKKEATDIAHVLHQKGFCARALQGDMSQRQVRYSVAICAARPPAAHHGGPTHSLLAALPQRQAAMEAFRSGETNVLVATDVAARGLDVKGVSAVINFSFGMSLPNYVHRVGRCGRAGARGQAITFLIDGDEKHADGLLAMMERARQPTPPWLREMAQQTKAVAARGPRAELSTEDRELLGDRIANREKQLQMHRARRAKEKAQGGRGSGPSSSSAETKQWRRKKKR